ncbi:hypothetical protein HYU06_02660 [Candidatus Woesearchaeota archaeon]|nr:hypothetical protein [Candidatus Woesearchaeota archaeon]
MNKKIIIFIMPIIILIITSLIYLGFISSFKQFGATNNRFIAVLNKFDTLPEGSLIFIGDSQIREDISCLLIESKLNNSECFNLAVEGIIPSQIMPISFLLTATNPKAIVIGVSPLFFYEGVNKNNDLFFFMNNRKGIVIDKFMDNALTKDEKELLFMLPFDKALYKRKFVLQYFLGLLNSFSSKTQLRTNPNNFKDPYIYTENQPASQLDKKLNDSAVIGMFDINKSSKRQLDIFGHFLEILSNNKLQVIVVQMPLNPLLTDTLGADSLQNYHSYLSLLSQKYNFTLLNLQDDFAKDDFTDLTHLNSVGRQKLAFNIISGDYHIIQ